MAELPRRAWVRRVTEHTQDLTSFAVSMAHPNVMSTSLNDKDVTPRSLRGFYSATTEHQLPARKSLRRVRLSSVGQAENAG